MGTQSEAVAAISESQAILATMLSQQECPAVQRIGAFAFAARPEYLSPDVQQLSKRNFLDSLSCAIATLAGPPYRALRDQFEEYRAPGRLPLIGGGEASADQAALFNFGFVRYDDLLDSYMSSGRLCHPGVNFETVLAAAEHAGRPARTSCWRLPWRMRPNQ